MRGKAGQHTVAPFSHRGLWLGSCCHKPINDQPAPNVRIVKAHSLPPVAAYRLPPSIASNLISKPPHIQRAPRTTVRSRGCYITAS